MRPGPADLRRHPRRRPPLLRAARLRGQPRGVQAGPLTPPWRGVAFDPTGTGRAAEVLGDLERARRVSVVVPGVD
ncbi:alpha/beta hydrolase, partial [Streptomyces hydrogenans]